MMRWNLLKADSIKKALKTAIAAPFLLIINLYRYIISPVLPASCRYHPSCSAYTYEAIQKHGVFIGLCYGTKRILSCHPWSTGGYDPVPECSHGKANNSDQHIINKAQKNG